MGIISKVALIGVVCIAVLIAIVWDAHNQTRTVISRNTEENKEVQKQPREVPVPEDVIEESSLTESPQELIWDSEFIPRTHSDSTVVQVSPAIPVDNTEPNVTVNSQRIVKPQPSQPVNCSNISIPKKYTVKKGDTLMSIARDCYSDGLKWKAVYEANREVITDPNSLIVGREITIPSLETAEKIAAIDHPARTTYIIQKSDTLLKIAELHYGDSTRWRDILAANKNKITDKDRLLPGTVLIIPDSRAER
ncbi:MAG: LysM peptidoglycan-binding domain-containing protein, partial [Planctomycetota bacterium]